MEQKFFMHRIKQENGSFVKGIEVHDTRDSAILSFWSYQVYAYGNPEYPNVTFVSCMITDIYGNVLSGNGNSAYAMSWRKPETEMDNVFFMHHIRKEGDTFSKDIDICTSFDAAKLAYSKAMAYGYNNSKFPNVQLVSCMITDTWGGTNMKETWIKPEVEPEAVQEE
jgi:hypothetical protein